MRSVHRGSLRTTVHELGRAFAGTGPDLQRIIDTGTSFIRTANRNFDVTTALIRDSDTVLRGQVASSSAIRSFARDLRLFSGTLAGHDRDLRRVIDNGSVTATQLRTFLQDNRVDLADLINNLVTTGDIVVKHLPGIRQILVVYPYVVEGGFTVVSKSPETGLYDAHFGLVLTNDPTVCHQRLPEHRHPGAAGRLEPSAERQRPLHRARLAVRRARCPARARRPPRRVVPRPGGGLRPVHRTAHLGPPPPEAHTHGSGEPRPGHAWRGVVEMATATASDAPVEVTPEEPTPEGPASGPPQATRFRAVLLGVLAVALVVSGAFAVHLGSSRHVWPFPAGADPAQTDREAVMAQTQQFVLRLNTYGPSMLDAQGQMPEYRSRVKAVITPKFAVSFDQSVAIAEQSVKNYGLHRTCAVFATGVELLDSDSAQVLVAGSFSQTARDRRGQGGPHR